MTPEEMAAVGRLGGQAAAGIAAHVEQVHGAIATRSFGATGAFGAGVRVVHDGVAAPVYALTRGSLRAAGTSAGSIARLAALPRRSAAIGTTAWSNHALAALNAVIGQRLHAEGSPLAIRMAVRVGGRDVATDPASLAVAFPAPSSKLAVLVHGLGETEHSWRLGSASGRSTYGAQLADELGYTPVELRYNTGRHISDNGRALSHVLTEVVEAWPCAVTEVLVVGHSMGGLVTRAACHHGNEEAASWVPLLRDVVYLGSPHTGALGARGARALSWALASIPETRGYAAALDHSPGIRDLRFGYVVEDDWRSCDAGRCLRDHGNEVPLLATANHYVVSATRFGDVDSPAGRYVGDLLVTPASAHGRHRRRTPLAFHQGANRVGLSHLGLVNDPGVFALMRQWLAEPPAVPISPVA